VNRVMNVYEYSLGLTRRLVFIIYVKKNIVSEMSFISVCR
jgi:hypothetical protein